MKYCIYMYLLNYIWNIDAFPGHVALTVSGPLRDQGRDVGAEPLRNCRHARGQKAPAHVARP